jgi:hypothetical protein
MEPAFTVLAEVAVLLDSLGIKYVLVGSLASSAHGMYRATADIDILADIQPDEIRPLVERMATSFYVDEAAVREAVAKRRSFNAIHYGSVFKVDIFIPKRDDFTRAQLERRQLRTFQDSNDHFYVASVEDTILAKLNWYRSGNEVSTMQWNDVVGLLGANEQLDFNYLESWAEKLSLMDLLERARDEAY